MFSGIISFITRGAMSFAFGSIMKGGYETCKSLHESVLVTNPFTRQKVRINKEEMVKVASVYFSVFYPSKLCPCNFQALEDFTDKQLKKKILWKEKVMGQSQLKKKTKKNKSPNPTVSQKSSLTTVANYGSENNSSNCNNISNCNYDDKNESVISNSNKSQASSDANVTPCLLLKYYYPAVANPKKENSTDTSTSSFENNLLDSQKCDEEVPLSKLKKYKSLQEKQKEKFDVSESKQLSGIQLLDLVNTVAMDPFEDMSLVYYFGNKLLQFFADENRVTYEKVLKETQGERVVYWYRNTVKLLTVNENRQHQNYYECTTPLSDPDVLNLLKARAAYIIRLSNRDSCTKSNANIALADNEDPIDIENNRTGELTTTSNYEIANIDYEIAELSEGPDADDIAKSHDVVIASSSAASKLNSVHSGELGQEVLSIADS